MSKKMFFAFLIPCFLILTSCEMEEKKHEQQKNEQEKQMEKKAESRGERMTPMDEEFQD